MSDPNAVVPYGDRRVGRIEQYGPAVIDVVFSIFINVRRWWNGEITGERCAKNIIDDLATVGGALAGAAGGAVAGVAVGGPIGGAIGGVVGAFVGGVAANYLIQKLTEELFDLPKTEALEEAYKFMGLHRNDSNEKVNARYRELARVYHPDKEGGSEEKFCKLSACVAIIKAARESEWITTFL